MNQESRGKKFKVKKWDIRHTFKVQSSEFKINDLINLLFENRGIKSKKEREKFLHPRLEEVTPEKVGIDSKQLENALSRIKKSIEEKEQIVVFGDYDVDGITGTAIIWETLFAMGAMVVPYIPNRVDEGYGLSLKGISHVQSQISNVKLIITVDNGIVAKEAVAFANEQGMDVIVTDHHTIGEKLPDAFAIVHTTKLCGAGIAYILSKELKSEVKNEDTHLELATLGTVADLVPLTGANRAIVKFGLEKVCRSKRPGLQELCKQAGIIKDVFSVYEIGYIIAPRLNAVGRIESAMDSLRLLCTKDPKRAYLLAQKLEATNKERQMIMKEAAEHAIDKMRNEKGEMRKILIVAHESYKEGVIGLVAGKLVEEFYRPSIVLSIGQTHSKGSARSISGFNIIEFLRSFPEYFVNVGGHPMAAGFTIASEKIAAFQNALEEMVEEKLSDDLLTRTLRIDCELPLSAVTQDFYDEIQQLSPFGMGNPEPVFVSRRVRIEGIKIMGRDGKHLKLTVRQTESGIRSQESRNFEAIAFGMAGRSVDLQVGDTVDVAYTIDENRWNGNVSLQLKVKDIQIP